MSSRRRPTSERAVTVVSMKYGWRCSSRALSAPAYPAAPKTATSGVTDASLQLLGQGGGDLAPPGRDLLVGQRPVRRAEVQSQRQGDVAGADPLLVAVDVEHPGLGEQRAARPAGDVEDLRGADGVRDDDREVL